MDVKDIVVSKKTPIITEEEFEQFGFGYGITTDNVVVSKSSGGGGGCCCCCCCCCCCGGATGLEE